MIQDAFYIREIVHYFLHLIFPAVIAKIFFKDNWRIAYFLLLATMLVDLDHIFSTPVFDPNRSSIGFHPLHTYPMIAVYFLGVIFLKGKYKIISAGLLLHMFTDFQDFYLWKLLGGLVD
ncbi:DUF6122 family protein [Chryseobacterium sp.]|uniref:DUF6122 family protein n=1 Tax=Chryseobacterium sp. TaxID=1871047 RepID=UPI0011CCC0ED|nr:DUF6122 family protein [Chryseobacterium sp.]TXF76088.1 hypothetical protein FUA25_09340 [Chryseobacterium sp.]